jgi:hypothetical protein
VLSGIAGAVGCAALPRAALADRPARSGQASALEQFGIGWTFSRPHACGQYVQGDWWVVGPVEVIGVSPPSQSGARVANGSMVNPKAGPQVQGYDSAMYGEGHAQGRYDAALNAALDVSPQAPLIVPAGSSIVSTISEEEPGARPGLRSAAILTVVDAPPPEGAFRPPYCGADKSPKWNAADLRREELRKLRRARGGPSLAELETQFERPWIDHVRGWLSRYIHPSEAMPDYGRDIAIRVGQASLMLNADIPLERKELLLQRFVQLGIDLYGVAMDGGGWPPDGGHNSGRKLPILFAGLLLGDEGMLGIGRTDVMFSEDAQTFYVEETAPGEINGGHGGYRPEHIGMPEWGIRHATEIFRDNVIWDEDKYRTCCTANAWVGEILTAHVMGLREAWAHEALFDYQDRYMAMEPAEPWRRSKSAWSAAMWDMHRADYPPVWG